jgi:WD40 repeat protein
LGCYGHVGVAGLGDFEEVVRLQAGIREWLLRTARNGRHELRGIPAPAVLPLLCAAAFGAALTEAADLGGTAAVARVGVLSSVGASALGDILGQALDRVRSAHPGAEPSRGDVQREVSRGVQEALSAVGPRADEVRSDVAMVLREIDAGGTAFRAAIEAGDGELEREVLAAVEAVSAEFGELEFLLVDLARAAGEIQDSLGGQGTELRAASEQVLRQSADVRVIREELAIIEQRTRQWVPGSGPPGRGGPRWTDGCPYRGLLPYEQAHEAVFCGRGRLTATLAGTLAQAGLVMVTGASGAGKTSLLQAGLMPALTRGVQVPGSSSWLRIAMKAGTRPLAELADRLARLDDRDPAVIRKGLADAPSDAHLLISEIIQGAGAARLVLVVDQFEEIFATTGQGGARERASFIDAVSAAATRPAGPRGEPPALVVIAVRGDYWDRCAAYPGLVRAMQQDQVVVGPMTDADLRHVITGPAQASGLTVEPDLVEAILADLRSAADNGPGGPGALPLLSQALMLTWERRDGTKLTKRGFQDAGNQAGIARAVEVTAETAYRDLTEDQQAIAREAFRRMTAMGPDRRPVRRAATSRELHSGRPKSEWPEVDAVLEAFARGRLLVLDTGRAEIAHDVLLQAWPRLRGWLAEDETSMILYGQLAEDTAQWRSSGGDRTLLYRGVQLTATAQAARVWDADPGRYPALSTSEADFLRASGRALARGRWRRRTLAAMAVVLVIAALAGAGIAVKNARTSAAQQSTANTSQRLAAQSTALDAADPVTAALLAGAAWRLAPTAQARYSLLQSLAQPVRGVLTASSGVVTALAYNPDGTTLAAGYSDGAIRLWDLASHRLVSATSWGAAPLALAFTSGGKELEVADAAAAGTWNLTDQARITAHPFASPAQGDAVAFSPGGQNIATGGADGNVRLWNAATQQEIGPPMSSDAKPVAAVSFSPDGTLVAAGSADGNVQLWDTATQQEAGTALVAGAAVVAALTFSPDGKLLATGGQDGAVRLWDVATQSQAGTTMATGDAVSALAFGPGGTTLASAESDGATELWNVATHTQTGAALTVQGSAGVSALAFSPAADALATGNGNGSIQLWNPAGFHQPSAPLALGSVGASPAAAGHTPAAFSANGGLLVTSNGHGTVRVWDVTGRRPAGPPMGSYHTVTGLALSPDGKTLAVAGSGVQLWQTGTGQRIGATLPSAGNGRYRAVAFSPDGTMLATLGADGTARIWDVATQQPDGAAMTVDGPGTTGGAVAFSPDGRTLATAGASGQVELWSLATRQRLGKPMPAGQGITMLAFSPGGATLATAASGGSVRLWNVSTQQEIGAPMTADAQPVYAVAFGPGGRTLATAGGDGSVRIWAVATQQEIGAPMTAGIQPVYAAAFGPGGGTLATAGGDGAARTWDVAFPANLVPAACGIASGSLTRQQWADYAGSQPFQQVCPAG